ncbi:MAG: hypothetical protein ACKOVB_07570 [Terrabacter sp.]
MVVRWSMEISSPNRGDVALGVGHLTVGAATVVLGLIFVVTSRSPGAELETVLLVPGLVLVALGVAFSYAALRSLRSSRPGALPLLLSVVEIVTGSVMFAAMAVAVRGYGAFQPWRSPLLVPSLLLIALGVWAAIRALEARRA